MTNVENKVAHVTLAFWIMKICATTLGETGGDLVSMTLNLGYIVSSLILIGFFLIALGAQLRAKSFRPFLYWGVILATSTAGTTVSDFMDRTLALGYATDSLVLVCILIFVLTAWHWRIGSLRVDHISDPKVETFYWTAILVSNTLGTALGDFFSDTSGFGFGLSSVLIASGIAVIAFLYYVTPISRTMLFWSAFVLTRPFGATLGDLLTKTPKQGGLGFGTIGSSTVLFGILLLLIYRGIRHTSKRLILVPLRKEPKWSTIDRQ